MCADMCVPVWVYTHRNVCGCLCRCVKVCVQLCVYADMCAGVCVQVCVQICAGAFGACFCVCSTGSCLKLAKHEVLISNMRRLSAGGVSQSLARYPAHCRSSLRHICEMNDYIDNCNAIFKSDSSLHLTEEKNIPKVQFPFNLLNDSNSQHLLRVLMVAVTHSRSTFMEEHTMSTAEPPYPKPHTSQVLNGC